MPERAANPAPKVLDRAGGRALDRRTVQRVVERWGRAAEPPWLHAEVARRMAERLTLIKRRPDTVLEWWGHAGAGTALLSSAYPQARRLCAEPTEAAKRRSAEALAAPWWSARRWRQPRPEVLDEDRVPPAAARLVWANMMLHAAADPPEVIGRWRQAIAPDGFLMFSALGPGSMAELRGLYRELGWGPPAADFVDMHDLGDMLVQAGFADPVMDQETLTLHWPTPEALLAELRGLGANAAPARFAGLRTPRWRVRLADALRERASADGRIALSFEVAYGHAFVAPPRAVAPAPAQVPLDEVRRSLRAARREPPAPGG